MSFSFKRTLGAAGNIGKSLLGKVGLTLGGGKTYQNPYNAVNLDFLKNTPTPDYSFLKSMPTPDYSFLNSAASSAGNLAGQGRTYADYLPQKIDTPALQYTLDQIRKGTNANFGNELMSQYSRGLAGDGNDSDIARNALAQVVSGGNQATADAYAKAYTDATGLASKSASDYNSLLQGGANLSGNLLGQYAQGLTGNANRASQGLESFAQGLTGNANRESNQMTDYARILSGNYSDASKISEGSRQPGLLRDLLNNITKQGGSNIGDAGSAKLLGLI